MATIDEPTVYPRRNTHLLPLSPRVPASTDRHFEQYLIDHHHFPKLPSIAKHPLPTIRQSIENKDFLPSHQQALPIDFENHPGSVNRLLNSEQYLRSHARLIEYRQQSRIPGVALKATHHFNEMPSNGRNDVSLPLTEVFLETTRTQQHQNPAEIDFIDDESVFSNETDRRQRAKHWIKEHQFFFTEYQ
jgi:hypothetical protein